MKVVITHCLSDSNKGVLAVMLATIGKIRAHYPDAEITLHSMYPAGHAQFDHHARFVRRAVVQVREGMLPSPYMDDSAEGFAADIAAVFRLVKYTVAAYALPHLPRPLRRLFGEQAHAYETLAGADLIFMKGGQDIYNDQGGLRGHLYLWRMLQIIASAIDTGVPVVILGQSFGQVTGEGMRRRVRDTLRRCREIVVRDSISAEFLASIGVRDNVVEAPDIGFLTEKDTDCGDLLPGEAGRWVGVTVVNWQYDASEGQSADHTMHGYVASLVRALETVWREHAVAPVLIAQDATTFHGSNDLQTIGAIADRLRQRGVPVHIVDRDISPSALACVYSRCALILGTRFHSCVLSATVGTPIVAIEYQGTKTRGLMRSLGLEDYVHEIASLDAETLTRSIATVLERREEIAGALRAKATAFRAAIGEKMSEMLLKYGPRR